MRLPSGYARLPCAEIEMAGPIEVFDPHFHIWDIRDGEGYADKTTLFAPAGTDHEGLYDAADLEKPLIVLLYWKTRRSHMLDWPISVVSIMLGDEEVL